MNPYFFFPLGKNGVHIAHPKSCQFADYLLHSQISRQIFIGFGRRIAPFHPCEPLLFIQILHFFSRILAKMRPVYYTKTNIHRKGVASVKLTLTVIRDYLPESFRAVQHGPKKQIFPLKRPILYESTCKLEPNSLYIGKASAIPLAQLPESSAAVCIGNLSPGTSLPDRTQYLSIAPEHSVSSVFNAVQRVYDRFDTWDHALMQALGNEMQFDIKRFIRLGVEMLENPFFMMNPSVKIIFSSSISKAKNGRLSIQVSNVPQNLPVVQAANMKEVCTSERLIRVPYISSVPSEQKDRLRVYCYNLYPLDYFMGCVWFKETYRPFRDSDFYLANHFFLSFEKAFLQYLLYTERKESQKVLVLQKLLDGKDLKSEEAAVFSLQKNQHWMCFCLRENTGMKYMPRDYMHASVNALMPDSIFAVFRNNAIVGLLCIQEDNTDPENDVYLQFRLFSERMGYIGGISNSFTDIQKIRYYLQQAEFAAKYTSADHVPLSSFQQHLLDFILYSSAEIMPFDLLKSTGYLALQAYDLKKGASLLDTLDVFLQNEMNLSQTASQLFIHRSSLQKRLDRIQQITGDNLDDPKVRLYYRICLQLRNR